MQKETDDTCANTHDKHTAFEYPNLDFRARAGQWPGTLRLIVLRGENPKSRLQQVFLLPLFVPAFDICFTLGSTFGPVWVYPGICMNKSGALTSLFFCRFGLLYGGQRVGVLRKNLDFAPSSSGSWSPDVFWWGEF